MLTNSNQGEYMHSYTTYKAAKEALKNMGEGFKIVKNESLFYGKVYTIEAA